MEKYQKLNKAENYDLDRAELPADLQNEMRDLAIRLDELNELNNDNQELRPFIWKTADGKCIALHKLEDDHLKNILGHLVESGRDIKAEIKAEARKRSIQVPPSKYNVGARRRYIEKMAGGFSHHGLIEEGVPSRPPEIGKATLDDVLAVDGAELGDVIGDHHG